MILDFLSGLFSTPTPVASCTGIRAGRAILEGTLRSSLAIQSPIYGVSCVAFYYRAWYVPPSRGRAAQRLLKEAEVYAPLFSLEMDGGSVSVVPLKSADFDMEQHQKLALTGLQGFRAEEQVIRPGDRVQVHGRVRKAGEAPEIVAEQIVILAKAPQGLPPRPPAGKKRSRR